MANGKTVKRRRRGKPENVVNIPFRMEELKGLILEKLGTKNKGGRPRKT